ncbi:hypothetical protein GGH13_005515 [Coemansia sp. S155-1]|nr:hypothetical protein GGI14_005256 [Coemansia sp. S680]KAJ2066937.1 hypothetical protein GGH13_005515 [Coemansia sp. S155-1]
MATVEQQIGSTAQEGIRTTRNDHILMLQEEYTRRHFPGRCKPFWSKEVEQFYDRHPQILDNLQAQHHEQCQAKVALEEQQRLAKEEQQRQKKEARKVKCSYRAVVCELKQRGQRLAREERQKRRLAKEALEEQRRLAKEARKLARRLAREERARNPPPSTSACAIHRAYRKSVHAARNITLAKWLEKFKADFFDYPLPCMYNVDELLYQFEVEGGDAMLVTIILACNGDGTQRLPPVLIFMEKDRPELPLALVNDPFVVFTSSGCLHSDTFASWIVMFGNFLRFLEQSGNPAKIILTLDGNSPHRSEENELALAALPNASNRLFPAHQTRLVQPLDRGIIQDFRLHINTKRTAYWNQHNDDPPLSKVISMIREAWHADITMDVFVKAFNSSYKFDIRHPNYKRS